MESRGCSIRFKKTTTFDQIAFLTQLPQIPNFIASTKPFRDHMIDVHLAFTLATHLTTAITLDDLLSDLTPTAGAATFPCS